jgi:hypothetical protein
MMRCRYLKTIDLCENMLLFLDILNGRDDRVLRFRYPLEPGICLEEITLV